MPICKVYSTANITVPTSLLQEVEGIVTAELHKAKDQVELMSVKTQHMSIGHVYIEIFCRNKPDRTFKNLANLLDIIENKFNETLGLAHTKIRIIKFEEDHLIAAN